VRRRSRGAGASAVAGSVCRLRLNALEFVSHQRNGLNRWIVRSFGLRFRKNSRLHVEGSISVPVLHRVLELGCPSELRIK
jgi:hypothetical protein